MVYKNHFTDCKFSEKKFGWAREWEGKFKILFLNSHFTKYSLYSEY